MAKKKRVRSNPADASEAGGFDLTPMIDVTFLLIIFFMIVTDIANRAKPTLLLPLAEEAEEDLMEDQSRLLINIMKNGQVRIGADAVNDAVLDARLISEAARSLRPGSDFPTRAVMIRADRHATYGIVQKVMAMCMHRKLWRIAFQTKKDENAV